MEFTAQGIPKVISDRKKKQAVELALALAEKWWDERKFSYNWNPEEDVAFLAQAIYEGKIPETEG